jgi:hypothetical protein
MDGEELVAEAIVRLERSRSISAKFRQQAELFGTHLVGTGIYLQRQDTRALMRLEMKLQVDQHQASLQQVCDGHFLWSLRRIDKESALERVEVARVLEVMGGQGRAGGLVPRTANMAGGGLCIGGLPELMRSLNRSFRFSQVTPSSWAGVPVYVVTGAWETATLERLLPDQKEAIAAGRADLSKLPQPTPDAVNLVLGRDDLFPYRVEYRRTSDDEYEQRKPGEPIGPPRPKTYLILEWFEVQRNVPLDPQLFQYQPGDVPVNDQTAAYIESIKGG